jgi:hypothetical protein
MNPGEGSSVVLDVLEDIQHNHRVEGPDPAAGIAAGRTETAERLAASRRACIVVPWTVSAPQSTASGIVERIFPQQEIPRSSQSRERLPRRQRWRCRRSCADRFVP